MYRLEIVTGKRGPDPVVWSFFPSLVPVSHSDFYAVFAAKSDEPLPDDLKDILDGWVEDEDIVSWTCEETPEQEQPGYVTTNKAGELTARSGSYWRNKAASGEVPGAFKPGSEKYWLIPMSVVEHFNRNKQEDDLYIIKASGPGPAFVYIRRAGDSLSDPVDMRNHMLLSPEQEAAYWRAIEHVKQNDKEAALQVLREAHFEKVWIE
jgi:hypothetical protein